MKEEYEDRAKKREGYMERHLSDKFKDQWRRYVEPFRMIGNIYYVGDSWVCVHLIDTGDGLLLIDAGNTGAEAMLVHEIWSLGFNPKDVKWIVLSHGHVDHIGAAMFFRNMFGTKIYMGKPDAEMFQKNPELSYVYSSPNLLDDVFTPDYGISDGETISLGNEKLRFVMVPGHTSGTLAFFTETEEQGNKCKVGYFGGFGFNTIQKDYLKEIGDREYKMREAYLSSIDKVIGEEVDVFLGNHTANNNVLEKRKMMKGDDDHTPFIVPNEWRDYLSKRRKMLLEFMSDPRNN